MFDASEHGHVHILAIVVANGVDVNASDVIHICRHTHTYSNAGTHTHIEQCERRNTYMHTNLHMCTHTHTHTHTRTHMHTYAHQNIRTCRHTHIQTYMHAQTYTHKERETHMKRCSACLTECCTRSSFLFLSCLSLSSLLFLSPLSISSFSLLLVEATPCKANIMQCTTMQCNAL